MQHHNNQLHLATPSGKSPTLVDIWKLVVEIRDRLEEVERQQREHVTAFSINDLNKPDFDGHRRSHVKLTKSDEIVDSYKQDATKTIISIVIVFFVGVFSTGLITKLVGFVK